VTLTTYLPAAGCSWLCRRQQMGSSYTCVAGGLQQQQQELLRVSLSVTQCRSSGSAATRWQHCIRGMQCGISAADAATGFRCADISPGAASCRSV
jgi:hypothetical protein